MASSEEDGGYLTFSTGNSGTLTLTYSKTAIPDSLCFFSPKKAIAGFKYTSNAGRTELMRNMGVEKSKYYEGVAAFIKAAASYDADITVLNSSEFAIYVLEGSKVTEVHEGDTINTTALNAAAIMPHGSDAFSGVKSSTLAEFANKGSRGGAKWTR